MSIVDLSKQNCHCDNEAEVIFKMIKCQKENGGTKWTYGEIMTPVCCDDEEARIVYEENKLTIYYADGTISTYTHTEHIIENI